MTHRHGARRATGFRTACLLALALGASSLAVAQDANALRAAHDKHRAALERSPFKRPLVLESNAQAGDPRGHVYAVIDHPFPAVASALQRADRWCDVFILQTNVKRCVSPAAEQVQTLRVAVARRHDQTVEQAQEVAFRYSTRSSDAQYLSVQLAADAGPLGTRDYQLSFEAVPLGEGRTFVHMAYAYTSGMAARLATEAYLSSAGRSKVGFSVTGRDAAGAPVLVGGMQGVAERNTMRYFLAIEALLSSQSAAPAEQLEARLRAFFEAIERYPQQLHELSREEYFAMKRREARPLRS